MTRIICIALLFLGFSTTLSAQKQVDYKAKSHQIYQWILKGEFGKVILEFDTNITSKVDSAKLAVSWDNLKKAVGEFVKVTETTIDTSTDFVVIIQKSEFEKKVVDFKLVYGLNEKVKGIFFVPVVKKFTFGDPSYYNAELIVEKPRRIITGDFRLPGILTLPKNVNKPPLAILVHGSGPNDKDETMSLPEYNKLG